MQNKYRYDMTHASPNQILTEGFRSSGGLQAVPSHPCSQSGRINIIRLCNNFHGEGRAASLKKHFNSHLAKLHIKRVKGVILSHCFRYKCRAGVADSTHPEVKSFKMAIDCKTFANVLDARISNLGLV